MNMIINTDIEIVRDMDLAIRHGRDGMRNGHGQLARVCTRPLPHALLTRTVRNQTVCGLLDRADRDVPTHECDGLLPVGTNWLVSL